MKAVGYKKPLPIGEAESLMDIEVPTPTATGRDLLVKVEAISVNPVDVKVRIRAAPEGMLYKILGWDAAGVVIEVGPESNLFKVGDEVYYAGSLTRPGTNAEFHVVDERIVGKKPKNLDFAAAAALPLTTITAWELLFDRFGVRLGKPPDAGCLLIVGAAGGVGSILIQLARRLTGLTIIATASRPETRRWCLDLGAHYVLDHTKPLIAQLRDIAIPQVEFIAGLNATDRHYPALVEALVPQGKFGLIDDPGALDVTLLKRKSASLHWEYMFARPVFHTSDMPAQHMLLDEVANLIDAGVIRTTMGENLGAINAATLKRAHAMIESGHTRGKLVLAGF
jgi:zinc-binding alcohol dehydrogenase family protein